MRNSGWSSFATSVWLGRGYYSVLAQSLRAIVNDVLRSRESPVLSKANHVSDFMTAASSRATNCFRTLGIEAVRRFEVEFGMLV